jgi:hypothetical protein
MGQINQKTGVGGMRIQRYVFPAWTGGCSSLLTCHDFKMAVTFTSVLAFALIVLLASQTALMESKSGSDEDEGDGGGRIRLME